MVGECLSPIGELRQAGRLDVQSVLQAGAVVGDSGCIALLAAEDVRSVFYVWAEQEHDGGVVYEDLIVLLDALMSSSAGTSLRERVAHLILPSLKTLVLSSGFIQRSAYGATVFFLAYRVMLASYIWERDWRLQYSALTALMAGMEWCRTHGFDQGEKEFSDLASDMIACQRAPSEILGAHRRWMVVRTMFEASRVLDSSLQSLATKDLSIADAGALVNEFGFGVDIDLNGRRLGILVRRKRAGSPPVLTRVFSVYCDDDGDWIAMPERPDLIYPMGWTRTVRPYESADSAACGAVFEICKAAAYGTLCLPDGM